MLQTKAIFMRKESAPPISDCVIEKVIELANSEFNFFKNNLLSDFDFIALNRELMFVDENKVSHSLLIMGESSPDGYIVESSGYSYARYSAFLPNARDFLNANEPTQTASGMKLKDLLSLRLEDVHLCHKDIDNTPATIDTLSNDMLTAEGKAEWADVLNAKVGIIYNGFYGTQLEMSGVSAERLDKFSNTLAGYCSAENYDKWVVTDSAPPDQTIKL